MHSLSYQLYSSRNWDAEATFAMLKTTGLTELEGFGPFIADPGNTRALLDAHGMTMPSAHFALALVEDETARVIETAKALGVETVLVPFLMPDDRPGDRAGWQDFGKRLARAGKPIVDAGLGFGWHNHEFEFIPTADGCMPIEEIADASEDIQLELDLAWIHVAGQDPVDWLNRYQGRVPLVHLKDVAAEGENTDEDGWADLGHGVMDYARIVDALHATNVPRWVLEHDNPSDHTRYATRSFATASKY